MFPVNFAKFVRTPFLQNISRWLLLLRLKCKWKLWLQSKRIYTPHLPNLHIWNNTTPTTAKNLKFYSAILFAVSIYCPPPAYQNWLLICETGNKWHMCKSVYMDVSGGPSELFWDVWLVSFFRRKNSWKQSK